MTPAQLRSVVSAHYGNSANLLVREGNEICFVLGYPGLALGESIDSETRAQLKPLYEWAFHNFQNSHSFSC